MPDLELTVKQAKSEGLTMSKKWLWLTLVAAVLAFSGYALRPRGITLEQCKGIQVGMSEQEVTRLLGPPHDTFHRRAPTGRQERTKVLTWFASPQRGNDDFGSITGIIVNIKAGTVSRATLLGAFGDRSTVRRSQDHGRH